MIIVGGTYSEICFEPIWENIFGSGFRAASLVLENDSSKKVNYHTCADLELKSHLRLFEHQYENLSIAITDIEKSPEFHYDHPLKTPTISPRPDLFNESKNLIEAEGNNILVYGLLESTFRIKGKKVVYDPQSPVNPKTFSSTSSTAEQLVMVINLSEAYKITNSKNLDTIVDFFFKRENCLALVVKMGAQGALLFENVSSEPKRIPVYESDTVWPIGSGDVFSAYFAMNWFEGVDLYTSALQASKATSLYCNSKDLSIAKKLSSFSFPELIVNNKPEGQVYIAGPFFTFSQRWIINEVWRTLKSIGLNVFSPYHDVGLGKAADVVDKDIDGLDKSEIVFAIVDGLDSGTIFEIGYAICQKKHVIAFVQNEDEESLKMIEGTGCLIEDDFTTAIYKTFWTLASK
jgi:nucleoside 2-deoxyribosyltransferase